MPWYAVTPAWRARQVAADLFVLGWVVLWLLAARWVHATVLQLTRPAYGLRYASHRVDDGLDQTKARLDDVPLVGELRRIALDPLSGATTDVDRAAADFITGVERLALVGATLTALLPILVVLVPLAGLEPALLAELDFEASSGAGSPRFAGLSGLRR